MTPLLVAAPALVPLSTALLAVLFRKRFAQRVVSWGGLILMLACACALGARVVQQGVQRTSFGNWPAPFGIEFIVDGFGVSMTLITAIIATVCLLFQHSDADAAPESPHLHPLLFTLLGGVGGAFITADLFNLYVWFEVILLSSLGLLALGGRAINLEATLKYFVLNALGTLVLLMGIGYVYGVTGHLQFAALADAARQPEAARWLPFAGVVLLAFSVKAGVFPVFAWLPASYHTLPAPLFALFAALLTKVGVYAILRLLGDVLTTAPQVLYEVLGALAVATMIVGALGAAYHWDMRRILAFHIISQIGYLLLGVALRSSDGASATMFFLLHNILAKTNLILVAAVIFRWTQSYDLRQIGGLYAARPALAGLFAVSALAMVGVPPLSGFWGKFLLVREALALGRGTWAFAALLTGFLTLYSMLKIWMEAFWKDHPREGWRPRAHAGSSVAYVSMGVLATLILIMGFFPAPILRVLDGAAGSMAAFASPTTQEAP